MNENYTRCGRQTHYPEAVAGLSQEMQGLRSGRKKKHLDIPGMVRKEGDTSMMWRSEQDVGFGDRLRGLASIRMLAKLTGQTACVWWGRGEFSGEGNHDDVLEPTLYRAVTCEREWRGLVCNGCRIENGPVNLMSEAAIKIAHERGLCDSITDEELYAQWKRIARDIQPARDVMTRIRGTWERWQCLRPLGLHIRRTDALEDNNRSVNRDNVGMNDSAVREKVIKAIQSGKNDGVFWRVIVRW